MALLQRAVTDIGNNADAVYDSFEAAPRHPDFQTAR
jgi:hypothetical protein